MKITNSGQQTIAFLETPSGKPQETGQKLDLMINHTVTIPPYPVKSINHVLISNIKPNTLIEKEENSFLSIEQPDLIMIPISQN